MTRPFLPIVLLILTLQSCFAQESDSTVLDVVKATREKAIAEGAIEEDSGFLIDEWIYFEEDTPIIYPCLEKIKASEIDDILVISAGSKLDPQSNSITPTGEIKIIFKETPGRVKFHDFCVPE